MRAGAQTPEELETLLEDAIVLADAQALAGLLDDDAVLVANGRVARGPGEVARALSNAAGYVARPGHVLQARDTALVVAEHATSVLRRGSDGAWRYAISLLSSTREAPMTQDVAVETPAPVAVRSDEGEARWWFGALAVIKATAADTGGRFTIVEMTEPPGAQAPLHVHHREDEAFWILEGSVTLEVGGTTVEARAGDYAFGPHGIPHRYTVGSEGCRMLFICTPAGFEQLVREMSEPAAARTLPPPSHEPPSMEHVAAVAAANHCELLV